MAEKPKQVLKKNRKTGQFILYTEAELKKKTRKQVRRRKSRLEQEIQKNYVSPSPDNQLVSPATEYATQPAEDSGVYPVEKTRSFLSDAILPAFTIAIPITLGASTGYYLGEGIGAICGAVYGAFMGYMIAMGFSDAYDKYEDGD